MSYESNLEHNEYQEQVEQLQTQLDKHRWIPVTERLPEEYGEYLILPYVRHLPTLCWQDGWYWYDREDDAISNTLGHNMDDPLPVVTHWKKLIPLESEAKE